MGWGRGRGGGDVDVDGSHEDGMDEVTKMLLTMF